MIAGSMTGTIYNDKDGQARAMEELAYTLASGGSLDKMQLPDGAAMQDNKYIRLPYEKVDMEKAKEYLSK